MKAYVEIIQRKEREIGTDVLTHQRVSSFLSIILRYLANHSRRTVEWSGLCRQSH
jgi:isocitrate lyase